MTEEYYIIAGKSQKGPYDLVTLVKKIRNGSISASTSIQQADAAAIRPARDWPVLVDFFDEKKNEQKKNAEIKHRQSYSLPEALQEGWQFLQHNQASSLFSGFFVLMIIMMVGLGYLLLPEQLRVLAYMGTFVMSHFLLSFYLLSVLRMTRGQPSDFPYLMKKIFPVARALLLSSLLVSLPAILGLALLIKGGTWQVSLSGLAFLAIPGLFTLTAYAFTPLIILDQGYGFWQAMGMSRKSILNSMENAGVIFALLVINFIAAFFALLPMAITLPITMSALAEFYDESFS